MMIVVRIFYVLGMFLILVSDVWFLGFIFMAVAVFLDTADLIQFEREHRALLREYESIQS